MSSFGKRQGRYLFYDLFFSSGKIFETGTSNGGWGRMHGMLLSEQLNFGAERLAGMLCMTLTRLISAYPPSMEPLPHTLGHGKIRVPILSVVPDVRQSLCSMSEGWRKKGASISLPHSLRTHFQQQTARSLVRNTDILLLTGKRLSYWVLREKKALCSWLYQ